MNLLFLFLLVASAADPAVAKDPSPREVVIHVIEADGSPIEHANLTICRVVEKSVEDKPCETLFSRTDGTEVTLQPAARYTIEARLEGFLPTTIGPIEVNDWHYPPNELRLLLNVDIME